MNREGRISAPTPPSQRLKVDRVAAPLTPAPAWLTCTLASVRSILRASSSLV